MEAEEAVFGWAFLFFTPFGNDLLRRSDRNDLVEEAVLLLRRNDLELPIKKAGDRMAANISPVVFNHSGGDTGSRFFFDFFPFFGCNGGCVSDRGEGGEFVPESSIESGDLTTTSLGGDVTQAWFQPDDEEFFGTLVPIATTRKHEK